MDSSSYTEEDVRQELFREMTERLGYPASLIVLEKEISGLPHTGGRGRGRRLDLICMAPGIHPRFSLYPLLIIECKRDGLDGRALRQAMGYNAIVQAPFVCLANREERKTYLRKGKTWEYVPFLPPFGQLVESCKR